jgi:hypothetical protein
MFLEFDSTHDRVFGKNFSEKKNIFPIKDVLTSNFLLFIYLMLVFCCFEALNIKILTTRTCPWPSSPTCPT